MKKLGVWLETRLVGALTQNIHGDLGFAYDKAWLADEGSQPISISLPKRGKPFTHKACNPFFDGLLPEAGQRRAVAKVVGVSHGNVYALLDSLGGEVAGALAFLPIGTVPEPLDGDWPLKPLDDTALLEVLDKLPLRPMLAGEDGLRLSLAGAQAKLPVCVVGGQVHLPGPNQPTSHILKPSIPDLPGSTENEAFVMRLAAELGMKVAPVEPGFIQTPTVKRAFLLVERYDRISVAGHIHRLHQEDFCQALGIPSVWKYQSEGGPNLKSCFDLIRRVSALPGVDAKGLLDAVLFNVIVGNADAHGKNFSLLYTRDGLRLAPFYDLLSTAIYPRLAEKFAMKIGDQSLFERLSPRAWRDFAQQASVSFPFVKKRLNALVLRIPAATDAVLARLVNPGMDQKALHQLAALVKSRAEHCVSRI